MSSTPATGAVDAPRPWDAVLLDEQDPTRLVAIARDRRLVLEDRRGPEWVDLCWVDEVALALIDLAVARHEGIYLVYPAPAGQLGVLLAAQLLLQRFVRGRRPSSLGLVTADTTTATRTWEALRIATTGSREPLTNVFPCLRAGPEGESPVQGRGFEGLIVGQRCLDWPVDYLVVDHLAGPVTVQGDARTIEVFSDPLDPALRRAESRGSVDLGLVRARSRALEPRAGGPPGPHRAVLGRIGPVGGHRARGRRAGSPSSTIRRPRLPSGASARISASCARRSPTGRTGTSSEVCRRRGTISRL